MEATWRSSEADPSRRAQARQRGTIRRKLTAEVVRVSQLQDAEASCRRCLWKEEAALYDRMSQPYGQIFIMKADGTGMRRLTDSLWEDAMPRYVPADKGRSSNP